MSCLAIVPLIAVCLLALVVMCAARAAVLPGPIPHVGAPVVAGAAGAALAILTFQVHAVIAVLCHHHPCTSWVASPATGVGCAAAGTSNAVLVCAQHHSACLLGRAAMSCSMMMMQPELAPSDTHPLSCSSRTCVVGRGQLRGLRPVCYVRCAGFSRMLRTQQSGPGES